MAIRRFYYCAVIFSFAVAGTRFAAEAKQPTIEESEFRRLDTAVEWADSPQRAADLASEQSKLLFVMHLSGDFSKAEST